MTSHSTEWMKERKKHGVPNSKRDDGKRLRKKGMLCPLGRLPPTPTVVNSCPAPHPCQVPEAACHTLLTFSRKLFPTMKAPTKLPSSTLGFLLLLLETESAVNSGKRHLCKLISTPMILPTQSVTSILAGWHLVVTWTHCNVAWERQGKDLVWASVQ